MNKNIQAEYDKRLLSTSDGVSFFCLFGRDGITKDKVEGDWKTPIGSFSIREIYYRKDKLGEIYNQEIKCIPIEKDFAWCDDINKKEYNKFIKLPFNGSYENLWLEDETYDVVIVLGYNDSPVAKNKGSAIFIHVARDDMEYTRGCLALKKQDILSLIKKIKKNTEVEIRTI